MNVQQTFDSAAVPQADPASLRRVAIADDKTMVPAARDPPEERATGRAGI